MKRARLTIASMLAAGCLTVGAHSGYLMTMGPVVAGTGPFAWTMSHPINTLSVTPTGARTGVPAPFTLTGTGFNPSIFPRPFFALVSVSNAGTAGAILVKNEGTNPEQPVLTGWNPDELLTLSSADWTQDSTTLPAYDIGLVSIADLGTIPELDGLSGLLDPDATGVVPYALFTVPAPTGIAVLALGAMNRRRRVASR